MLEYWLARVLLAPLPAFLDPARVWVYGKLLDWCAPRLRRAALRNLEMAGLENRERITDGVFRSIARMAVTFARFPAIKHDNVQRWIRYAGLENFTKAHAR